MTLNPQVKKWFYIPRPNPHSKLRLFCFPYAGAGAMVFRDWCLHVPRDVEILALQAPGRESRFREAPLTQLDSLVDELVAVMPTDKPFAFFGHSLGALVAFELVRRLRQTHGRLPQHLFVSARNAPQTKALTETYYNLPDNEFAEKVTLLGGMDDLILQNKEMMSLILPILRADFQMNETYEYRAEPPLTCPISAFHGTEDSIMTYELLDAWRTQTASDFRLRTLEDGHFFINTARQKFWQIFSYDLNRVLYSL
jgi:medium-chain acyl-[acyl-carrier-protein] hydrolase